MAGYYYQNQHDWANTGGSNSSSSSPIEYGAVPMKKSDSGYESTHGEDLQQYDCVDPSVLLQMDSQYSEYEQTYQDYSPTHQDYPNYNLGADSNYAMSAASFSPIAGSPSQQNWDVPSPTGYATRLCRH